MTAAPTNTSGSFGQKLAHVDKKVRDSAVEKLGRYFAAKDQFTELELLKLWKALYYCFWLSDKPLIQQDLAENLGKLSLELKKNSSMLYIQTFWQTMNREWNLIDRHRVNKYYMLMRKMFFYNLLALEKYDFDKSIITAYYHMMRRYPLNPVTSKFPDGIRAHVGEICLAEIIKLKQQSEKEIPVALLVEPFVEFASNTTNAKLFKLFKEDILEFPMITVVNFEQEYNTLPKEQLPFMKEICKAINQSLIRKLKDSKIDSERLTVFADIVDDYQKVFPLGAVGDQEQNVVNSDDDGMLSDEAEQNKRIGYTYIDKNTDDVDDPSNVVTKKSGFRSEEAVIMKQTPPQSLKKSKDPTENGIKNSNEYKKQKAKSNAGASAKPNVNTSQNRKKPEDLPSNSGEFSKKEKVQPKLKKETSQPEEPTPKASENGQKNIKREKVKPKQTQTVNAKEKEKEKVSSNPKKECNTTENTIININGFIKKQKIPPVAKQKNLASVIVANSAADNSKKRKRSRDEHEETVQKYKETNQNAEPLELSESRKKKKMFLKSCGFEVTPKKEIELKQSQIESEKKEQKQKQKQKQKQTHEKGVENKLENFNGLEALSEQLQNDSGSSTPTGIQKKFKWALENNSTKRFLKKKPISPMSSDMDLNATPVRSALKKASSYDSSAASTPTNTGKEKLRLGSASKSLVGSSSKKSSFILGNVKSK